MNTKIIIWILGILFGVIVASALWYAMFAPKAPPQTSESPTTLPVSGSITLSSGNGTIATGSTPTISLTTQTGSVVFVRDFIHNGVTIPDTVNTGRYLLVGNLDYCPSNPQQCQAAPATGFSVYYNSGPESFTITLTEEPIGQARLAMEQFMLTTLGITQQQMCSLNYLVGVTQDVNSQFAGKNLGFSFCSGATVLPK